MKPSTTTQRLVKRALEVSEELDASAAAAPVEGERLTDAARVLEALAHHAARLELEVQRLRPRPTGKSAETLSAASLQQGLFDRVTPPSAKEQALVDSPTPPPPPPPTPKPKAKAAGNAPTQTGRRPFPRHLPRVEIIVAAPEDTRACSCCGQERRVIGYDTSEVLDQIPASMRVLVYKREKLACAAHPEGGVTTAPPAVRPFEKSMVSSGLLAAILIAKYLDHTPLHRQYRQFLRHGVDLAVSTMSGWVERAHEMLAPLATRIQHHAMASHLVQSDATGLRVLGSDSDSGVHLGQMWVILGDSRWALYRFAKDHSHDWPKKFLAARRGWLQVDAHPSYDTMFADPQATAVEVGCWVHARRSFFELHEHGDPRVDVPLRWIQALYAIEAAADAAGESHEERRERRQTHAAAVIDSFGHWLVSTLLSETPGSAFYRSVAYCVKNWRALTRFMHDGRLLLDNNGAERALRPLALGRKNYLFAGSDAGAEWAATAYTLLGTCILNRLNPWAWLRDTIDKLANDWPAHRLDELLPTPTHPLANANA